MAHYTSFDKLLEAMSKIADTSDSKLKYDKTVIMEIVQLVDASTGEYAVKYQGNTLQAFTRNLDDKYSTGDSVYVKIPEGDFTNQKIIESKVSNSSSDEQERNIISNTIIDVEPSWFSEKMYGALDENPFSLVSGQNIESQDIWTRAGASNLESADTLLTLYNKEYDKFIIKASFMNSFLGTHLQGNYGIRLTLKLIDISSENSNAYITQDFDLDTTCFTGNIYNLSAYSPQYAVFQIPKNSLLGVESLKFFQKDMEVDIWTKGEEKEEITNPNIYVKDISVNFVEVLDYTQDNYYLLIDTPSGNTLDNDNAKITTVPRLIYKGENVISDSSCKVYWYKENPDALIGTQMYSAQVGCGWELIDSESTLTISGNEVAIEQRYKVLVLYGKKQSPFSKIITIYKKNAEDDGAELLRETIKDKDYLYIKNPEYKGTWYRELPNGSYINLSGENYQIENEESTTIEIITGKDEDNENIITELKAFNKINITSLLSYSSFTIYCKIYKDEQFLVTQHYDITDLGEETDVVVTFEGEKVFRYDANGDITIEDSEKEQTINGKIAWREGAGTAFKVEWLDGNGVSIGATNTSLENSMLENVYVDNYNILHYTIRSKYYNYYQNNSLTMKITTIDGKIYEFPCDILFIKDGEPGTNGTTYITMIRPMKLENENLVLDTNYKGLIQKEEKTFRAYIYKDGKQINNGSEYEISYNWSGENIAVIDSKTQDIEITTPVIEPKENTETGLYDIRGYVLKVMVTIVDKSVNTTRKVTTYYNLPLMVCFGEISSLENFDTNIPNFIQYGSDGTVASFKYEELYVKGGNFTDISFAKDAINLIKNDNKYYLQLVNNYYYQTGSAALKINLDNDSYAVYTIMMYRNIYNMAEINGWDGTQLKLNEEENYLLAAMVGAGHKNSDNTFTGVVMGTIKNSNTEKDGLFGYSSGTQTFYLDAETGNAVFGKNQQIMITAKEATIKGNSTNGFMQLKLIPDNDNDKAIEITYNKETKFSVDYTGKMEAQNAVVHGDIYANYIEANTGGNIGGWTINANQLSGGSTTLHSTGGITTNTLQISTSVVDGLIGWVVGNNGVSSTDCIGITSSRNSIILQSDVYLRLSAHRLYVETDSPSDQHGIYARFA